MVKSVVKSVVNYVAGPIPQLPGFVRVRFVWPLIDHYSV